nr:MAG TPA: hypothetical protein [Caudoviricetes sp.]
MVGLVYLYICFLLLLFDFIYFYDYFTTIKKYFL